MSRRTFAGVAVAAGFALMASGCGFSGVNSLDLPFGAGGGSDAIVVRVELENAANLVANSEVKVGDVTVGSVRKITFEDWHATLVVGLEPDTRLPADALARIGQKSLLGAEYLELEAPAGSSSTRALTSGDVIPLARSSRYPETEEVLAALASLLNGGGLGQLRTITTELNHAFEGRQADWRSVVTKVNTFIGGLNSQRGDLVLLLKNVNRLGGTLAAQQDVLTHALDTLPDGLRVIAEERPKLVEALGAVGDFGAALTKIVDQSQDDLVGSLHDLRPVLRELADAGSALPRATGMVTFPFPVDRLSRVIRGDYVNLFLNVDLSVDRTLRTLLAGTPVEQLLIGLTGAVPPSATKAPRNPVLNPLDLPGLVGGLLGTPGAGAEPGPHGNGNPLTDLLGPLFGGKR